jgi:murein DD-endopeptidase MepM/ murein hydrolase activator NlpD
MQIFRSLRTVKVGQVALRLKVPKWLKRVLGLSLVVLTASVIVAKNANIGGTLALALETPIKPTIDVTTVSVVQTPVEFTYESRGLSWYHAGADLVASTGTPVKPIMAGIIKEVNFGNFGYGNHVIITHAGNLESLYAHLSKISVEKGQKVFLDTVIGEVGSTGFSTGPHLHLEIRQNEKLLNPGDLVPGVR